MYKPNYTLTDKLVLQLIDLEVAKSKIENQELTGTTAAELRKDTKAINMFHMAHLLGIELTLKDAAKAAEGKKVITPDKRGTVLNNFRNILEFTRADVSQYYNDVDMKVIYTITLLVFLAIVAVGLLNLASMFDEESCVCLIDTKQCRLYSDIENPRPARDYQRVCDGNSCKYIFGKCYKLPKYLDITYVVRGR